MPTSGWIIWDGVQIPQAYVQSIDKVNKTYVPTTDINAAEFYTDQTLAKADNKWLNDNIANRFGVHAHNH